MSTKASNDKRKNDDECLNCGETRGAVNAEGLSCHDGERDFSNHRWTSWSDKELDVYGILPRFRHLYRRVTPDRFNGIPCEHKGAEHYYTEYLDQEVCVHCMATPAEDGE